MLAGRTTARRAWATVCKWWLSNQRNNSQGDNKLQMLLHSWQCPPPCAVVPSRGGRRHLHPAPRRGGAGWASLGSLLLPSTVTPVTSWSLLPEPCMSPEQAATGPPTYSTPSSHFRSGVPRQPLYFSKKWFPLYPSRVLFLT